MKKKGVDLKKKHQKIEAQVNQNLRDSFKDSNVIFEEHYNPKKYSEIFNEFIKPFFAEVKDEESFKQLLDWGQIIWNKGVAEDFPDHPQSNHIEIFFPLFSSLQRDNLLVWLLLDRKRAVFGGEKFFIVKQSSLLSPGGTLAISVAVRTIEDTNLN